MAVRAPDAGLATKDMRDLPRRRKSPPTDLPTTRSTRWGVACWGRFERSEMVVRIRQAFAC
jgi:hypothetical protein